MSAPKSHSMISSRQLIEDDAGQRKLARLLAMADQDPERYSKWLAGRALTIVPVKDLTLAPSIIVVVVELPGGGEVKLPWSDYSEMTDSIDIIAKLSLRDHLSAEKMFDLWMKITSPSTKLVRVYPTRLGNIVRVTESKVINLQRPLTESTDYRIIYGASFKKLAAMTLQRDGFLLLRKFDKCHLANLGDDGAALRKLARLAIKLNDEAPNVDTESDGSYTVAARDFPFSASASYVAHDGRNFLHILFRPSGRVSFATRYGGNNPDKLLDVIGQRAYSEHDTAYWGY